MSVQAYSAAMCVAFVYAGVMGRRREDTNGGRLMAAAAPARAGRP
jgi:hypothetical protein